MSDLIWVIENYSNGEDIKSLIQEVKNQGFDCNVISESNHFEYKHVDYKDGPVLFYGSINMSILIREQLKDKNCSPVVWLTDENYLCSRYWLQLRDFLFNDNYEFLTVKKLKENKFEIYARYGKEALIFIRPDVGTKSFAGQLLDLQDFDRFWLNNVRCNAKDEDIVVVSTPKTITGEFRFVCDNEGNIITGSTYQFQGQVTLVPSWPKGAEELVKKVLSVGYYPDKMFTVDVAMCSDGKFWLLECNSFCSAGLYLCDMKKIVSRASELASEEWKEKQKVEKFQQHLKDSAKIVSGWPKWKQNILGFFGVK